VGLPSFAGWHLLGSFPDPADDGVGSWLLHHGGEAVLLELPPGLTVDLVRGGLDRIGCELRYVTASHDHGDHYDADAWGAVEAAFPDAPFVGLDGFTGDRVLSVGGEPLWQIGAPKHSLTDAVTVFRGVAMKGDIETGTLKSVNREVPVRTKRASMAWLRDFPARTGYRVHTAISAHLNSVRQNIDWPALFTV
jgi:hypothetical protein